MVQALDTIIQLVFSQIEGVFMNRVDNIVGLDTHTGEGVSEHSSFITLFKYGRQRGCSIRLLLEMLYAFGLLGD